MGKTSFQLIIEELLLQNNISPSAESYFLKLHIPSQDDFLVMGKVGDQVLIGFQKENLIGDPMLAFDYQEGLFYPERIIQKSGDTICSFIEDGNRMIIPFRLKRFMLLQGMFVRTIREQNFLENGVKVE